MEHLEGELKGINSQAAEPTSGFEPGNDVQCWCFRKIPLSLVHQTSKASKGGDNARVIKMGDAEKDNERGICSSWGDR